MIVRTLSTILCAAGGGGADLPRFLEAIAKGATFDEALDDGGRMGGQALRRGHRRRAHRTILALVEAIDFATVDSLIDTAWCASSPSRGVLTPPTSSSTRCARSHARSTVFWQYAAGCVDAVSSGLMTCSNLAEGTALRARRAASNLPQRRLLRLPLHEHPPPHLARPARRWARRPQRAPLMRPRSGSRALAWTAEKDSAVRNPPPLWGSHSTESSPPERELGVSALRQCASARARRTAAMEPGKLGNRAARRALTSGRTPW